jgi:hypothetical protein
MGLASASALASVGEVHLEVEGSVEHNHSPLLSEHDVFLDHSCKKNRYWDKDSDSLLIEGLDKISLDME